MKELLKNQTLANSSIWVASLLNFIPGLGTGYIYQRRWRAYWATNIVSIGWITISTYKELNYDQIDPIAFQGDLMRFSGLFFISIFTCIEAWFACNRTRSKL